MHPIYLKLKPGGYSAALTVQDQYNVASVTAVKFAVPDLANPIPPECGGKISSYDPFKFIRYINPGDPAPFRSVIRSYAVSPGEGTVVNSFTQRQIVEMGDSLGKGVGQTILRQASARMPRAVASQLQGRVKNPTAAPAAQVQ
jgi:hypothetical protein